MNVDEGEIPLEITEAAARATHDLLPHKSRDKYEKTFAVFKCWCKEKNVRNISEDVLLAYFAEKSEKLKSSTLWSVYSMIKLMLNLKENLDISRYYKLIAFIKRKSVGYIPKKSRVLTRVDIDKFLLEAPDNEYLLIKVSRT